MKNLFLLSIVFIWLSIRPNSFVNAQGVGVNEGGNQPDPSAILDASATNKGLLIPRVVLQSASDASTIVSPAASLLVYNLGTGGLSPAGYYYNAGTPGSPNWTKLATGVISGWALSGNGGTSPGTNFIGTTDPNDVVFKTNGSENVRIQNGGNVGIGNPTPLSTLDVTGSEARAISTTAISSATTLDATMSTIIATPSSAYTITLPALASSARRIYSIIYNGIPGTNAITISGNSANIIFGGVPSANYSFTGGSITLQNNGTNWYVTSSTSCPAVPAIPGTITGSSSVNCSSSGNVYSVTAVPNTAYYNWTLPAGATITSGAGTNTITVTFGTASGNIFVSATNGCGTSSGSPSLFISVGGVLAVDASSQVAQTSNASTATFTINTTTANEIILVTVDGYSGSGNPFNGNVAVTNAGTVTQVAAVLNGGGTPSVTALFACIPTATGSHTVTVTWGSNIVNSSYLMAYAASFKGFCSAPTVAANVQSITGYGTANASATITPLVASGCLFANFFSISGSGTAGVVTWTNETAIRTDHGANGCDGSIANTTVASTSPVTVTASCSQNGWTAPIMILAVVHP